jgi:hypothetical protein
VSLDDGHAAERVVRAVWPSEAGDASGPREPAARVEA